MASNIQMTPDRQKRFERLRKICDTIKKAEKAQDIITFLGSGDTIPIARFSSGCPELDSALGGGWPKGRFIELFGPESGGKSTTCLHAIAEFQKDAPDEDVALVDTEFSFDEEYARNLGVDTDLLLVNQPESGEQALKVVRHLIQLGVGLIIVDSVAALTPQAELDGDIGDQHVGQQARLMSQTMRILCAEAGKRGTTIFWTNQMREKIGVMYGDKTTTPGGRALRHYASIRVNISSISKEKDGEIIVGSKVQADVKKNKTAAPFKKAIFYISFGTGIDRVAAICDKAIAIKVVTKRGAKISYKDQVVGAGRKDFIDFAKKTPQFFAELEEAVKNAPKDPVDALEAEEGESAVAIKKPKGMIKRTPVTSLEEALPDGSVKQVDAELVEEQDA